MQIIFYTFRINDIRINADSRQQPYLYYNIGFLHSYLNLLLLIIYVFFLFILSEKAPTIVDANEKTPIF